MSSTPSNQKQSLRQRLFSSSSKKGTVHNELQQPNHPLENSASTSSTLAPPDDAPPDIDREQSSVNATLTARRVPFYRRITASDDATTTKPPRPSRSRSPHTRHQRPSLFARVVHRVVPCVTPDPALLAPDIDSALSPQDPPTDADDTLVSESSKDPAEMHEIAVVPTLTVRSAPALESEVIITPPPSARDETGLTSGAVQPPGSTGTPTGSPARTLSDGNESDGSAEEEDYADVPMEDDEEAMIRKGGSGIPIGPDGREQPLLPPLLPEHAGRKCLVLDLDETLVHSSFKAVQQADFVVPVEIEYHWHHFHVLKRPGVDDFLKRMGEIYEVVVFTASLSKYADPVLDILDPTHTITHRLFRESCVSHRGNYVKDLSQLGRPLASTLILDNSPASYIFHPHNAVPVSSWFNDPHDAELSDLVPFLRDLSEEVVGDVRGVLDGAR
ncbi:hypothetical protein DXG01_002526 [Tephrocybe rancida]|nr:hypothetical protein DXG01_002526 [Tephrocybe rancida]